MQQQNVAYCEPLLPDKTQLVKMSVIYKGKYRHEDYPEDVYLNPKRVGVDPDNRGDGQLNVAVFMN